jgi:hypothetical protein
MGAISTPPPPRSLTSTIRQTTWSEISFRAKETKQAFTRNVRYKSKNLDTQIAVYLIGSSCYSPEKKTWAGPPEWLDALYRRQALPATCCCSRAHSPLPKNGGFRRGLLLTILVFLPRKISRALRMIVDAPWYLQNTVIRRDLQILTVKEEIHRFSSQYSARLSAHQNDLTVNLMELTTGGCEDTCQMICLPDS